MSDLLIKGMEMPETCKLCYLSEFDPGFYAYVCKPTGIRVDYDIAKIDRPRKICPLIPIPPHGKLIDRDALLKKCEFVCTDDDEDIRAVRYSIIENTPTIIEADNADMDSFIRIFEEDDEEDGMDSFIRILKD